MRAYELVTLISPELDGERMLVVTSKIRESISGQGGVVEEMNQWGRRKLAYPVEKFMEANYLLARFKLEPKSLKELETTLKGMGDVLRYLVVRMDN